MRRDARRGEVGIEQNISTPTLIQILFKMNPFLLCCLKYLLAHAILCIAIANVNFSSQNSFIKEFPLYINISFSPGTFG